MLVLDIIVVILIVLVVLVSRVGMVVTAVAPHSCYGTHISNVDSVGTNLMAYRVIVVEVARMEILILMLKQNEATHLVVVFFFPRKVLGTGTGCFRFGHMVFWLLSTRCFTKSSQQRMKG